MTLKALSKAAANEQGLEHNNGRLVALTPVRENNWGLVITQDEAELYSPLYRKMANIGILFLVIYLLILTGFGIVMKPLAGRILMNTDELEKKIQEKTAVLEKEISERKKAEEEKEVIIAELKQAMGKIRTLSGMLPICSVCKKIGDDKGCWNQLEAYISDYSDAEFSHSICPGCAKKLYPDMTFEE